MTLSAVQHKTERNLCITKSCKCTTALTQYLMQQIDSIQYLKRRISYHCERSELFARPAAV